MNGRPSEKRTEASPRVTNHMRIESPTSPRSPQTDFIHAFDRTRISREWFPLQAVGVGSPAGGAREDPQRSGQMLCAQPAQSELDGQLHPFHSGIVSVGPP